MRALFVYYLPRVQYSWYAKRAIGSFVQEGFTLRQRGLSCGQEGCVWHFCQEDRRCFLCQEGKLRDIRKTCPCNEYPHKPHLYIVKLGYAGVYLFFLFLLQNIDCGFSLEPPRNVSDGLGMSSRDWLTYRFFLATL